MSAGSSVVTYTGSIDITRGDLIMIGTTMQMRVVRIKRFTLTVRDVHRVKSLEVIRFAFERYIKWPLGDVLASVGAYRE